MIFYHAAIIPNSIGAVPFPHDPRPLFVQPPYKHLPHYPPVHLGHHPTKFPQKSFYPMAGLHIFQGKFKHCCITITPISIFPFRDFVATHKTDFGFFSESPTIPKHVPITRVCQGQYFLEHPFSKAQFSPYLPGSAAVPAGQSAERPDRYLVLQAASECPPAQLWR